MHPVSMVIVFFVVVTTLSDTLHRTIIQSKRTRIVTTRTRTSCGIFPTGNYQYCKPQFLPLFPPTSQEIGARYAPPACVDNCRTKPVELVRNGKSVIRLPGAGPRMESSFMAERRRARTREGYMPTTYFLSTVGWGMRWNYRIWNMPFMRPCQKVERKLSYEMRDATTRIHLTALRREGSD